MLQNSPESDVVKNKKPYILHQNVVYFLLEKLNIFSTNVLFMLSVTANVNMLMLLASSYANYNSIGP